MKKAFKASVLCIIMGFMGNSAYADDQEIKPIKLKSKCIKQNPLVEGQTDHTLLNIYQQVCDKDNAARQNDLLAQAAMRMYELKQPINALILVNQLKQQNIRGNLLTDISFLASIEIANNALQQMRSDEMRYLNNELTYPPAKQLSDHILAALPAPDTTNIKAITDESLKKEVKNIPNPPPVRRVTNRSVRSTTSTRNTVTQATAPVKRQTVVTAPVAQKIAANPFDSLK